MNKRDYNLYNDDIAYYAGIIKTSFFVRSISIVIALIFLKLMDVFWQIRFPGQINIVFGVLLATSGVYYVIFSRKPFKNRKTLEIVHFSYYVIATIYMTLLVYFFGSVGWIAILLYFFELVYANVLLNRTGTMAITVFYRGSLFFYATFGILWYFTPTEILSSVQRSL